MLTGLRIMRRTYKHYSDGDKKTVFVMKVKSDCLLIQSPASQIEFPEKRYLVRVRLELGLIGFTLSSPLSCMQSCLYFNPTKQFVSLDLPLFTVLHSTNSSCEGFLLDCMLLLLKNFSGNKQRKILDSDRIKRLLAPYITPQVGERIQLFL